MSQHPVPDPPPATERFAARTAGMTASEIRALFAVASRPEVVSLAGGMPNLAALPLDALAAEVADLVAREGQVALQYGSAQGRPELREQICEVMALEGIRADPDDVVVTVGSQMALDLVTRIYCDPGDVVLAEGPSYVGALGSFAAYQARVVHVAMDAHGLVPDLLRAALGHRPAATEVPLHGADLPQPGRRHALRRAAGRGARDLPGVRRRRRRGQPVRAPWLQRAHLPGAALARPRRRLPGLVLQDVRVRAAGGLGARSTRRARPARAGRRIGDPLPAEFHPDAGLALPGGTRLAQPGQDVHRGLPRPPRRHARARWRPTCRPVARGTSPTAASTCGSPCPRASTRRRCSRARSRRGSPTRRAPGSTPTGLGSRQLRLSYCYPSPERITEGVRRLAGVLEAELDVLHTFGNPARPAVGRGPQAPSPSTP